MPVKLDRGVTYKGHTFIDRRLRLPKAWTDDPARLATAHMPAAVDFATMSGSAEGPRLAVGMIERAIRAGVPFAPRLPAAAAPAEADRPRADGPQRTASTVWARSRRC